MNDKVKIGLLAFIALFTVANTYLLVSDSKPSYASYEDGEEDYTSNIVANATPAVNNNVKPQNNAAPSFTASDAKPAAPKAPPTSMKFANYKHSFGKIKQDTKNNHTFKFTNSGDKPLIIENAKGSCGCTVPEWPKEPIAPGATGEIKIVYSPGKQKGTQNKNVTITANTEPAQTILNISAEVQEVAGAVVTAPVAQ